MTGPDITPSLKDHFLIATPSLQQGFFAQTVTYLCEHNEGGAMGIVINKPLGVSLEEIFSALELPLEKQPAQGEGVCGRAGTIGTRLYLAQTGGKLGVDLGHQ